MPERNFIDDLIGQMRVKGFAKPNRWIAIIDLDANLATKLGFSKTAIVRRLATTCSSINIPTKSFMTHEMNVSYPSTLIPYAVSTNNQSGASIEFRVLADMFEKDVFENWQNQIIDPVTKQANFYDAYAKNSSVVIVELPNSIKDLEEAIGYSYNQNASGIRLTEIYPFNVSLNSGTQSYDQSTESLKIKIDFMYREVTKISQPRITDINEGLYLVDDNGNDMRIRRLLTQGLTFISQGQGFLGQL